MTTIPRIEDLSDATFNPFLADEMMFGDHVDPYPRIAELRSEGAVLPIDYRKVMRVPREPSNPSKPHYTVLSYAAVEELLSKPDVFSNRSFRPTLGVVFGPILSVLDPPEHTIYRKLLQHSFRPQILQAWGRDFVEPVVEELIGDIRGAGRAELVEEFARLLPFRVLYRLLGLPSDDVDVFYRLTVAQLVTALSMENATEAASNLGSYFQAMLAQRREHPGGDIVSTLATAQVAGETLPEEVAIGFLRQLMSAGERQHSEQPPSSCTHFSPIPNNSRHCALTAASSRPRSKRLSVGTDPSF